MALPNFMLKAFSYQDFRRGALCDPALGHDQTKIPWAGRVEDTAIKRITVLPNSLRKDY